MTVPMTSLRGSLRSKASTQNEAGGGESKERSPGPGAASAFQDSIVLLCSVLATNMDPGFIIAIVFSLQLS